MLKKLETPAGLDQNPRIAGMYKGFNHFVDLCENGFEENNELLARILKENAESEFGKSHNFANITTIEEFKENVPLSTYDDYKPYIDRMVRGRRMCC